MTCDVCGLPDNYRGQGDGLGSCDCPRCDCGEARHSYLCTCPPGDDPWPDEGWPEAEPWPDGAVAGAAPTTQDR